MPLYLPITAPQLPGVRPAEVDGIEQLVSKWRADLLGMLGVYDSGLPSINALSGAVDPAAQREERWLEAKQATEGDGRWYIELPASMSEQGWVGARTRATVDLSSEVGMQIAFDGDAVVVPAPVNLDRTVFGLPDPF